MKFLIVLLILSVLCFGSFVPFIFRAHARTFADQVITGNLPASVKKINSCISILTWSNKYLTSRAHKDMIRIRQLNEILNEMLHPHG